MEKKIAVIGTVFMDIKGFSYSSYDPVGTNIGSISFVHGGVGRNAAENLANIGIPVSFFSTVDKSGSGDEIVAALEDIKVDISGVLRTENNGMGMWLAVLNEKGELAGSISQQPDLSLFYNHISSVIDERLKCCSAVVLEIDMTEDIAACVFKAAEKAGIPVYAIVGNMSVILQNKQFLSKTACFICNNIEAGKLCGKDLNDKDNDYIVSMIKKIAEELHIAKIIITNGEKGAVYYDRNNNDCGCISAKAVSVVDTTGAGDAFFSGVVGALTKNKDLRTACEYGAELASRVISSQKSTADIDLNFYN